MMNVGKGACDAYIILRLLHAPTWCSSLYLRTGFKGEERGVGRGSGSEPRTTKIELFDLLYTYLRLMFIMLPKKKN